MLGAHVAITEVPVVGGIAHGELGEVDGDRRAPLHRVGIEERVHLVGQDRKRLHSGIGPADVRRDQGDRDVQGLIAVRIGMGHRRTWIGAGGPISEPPFEGGGFTDARISERHLGERTILVQVRTEYGCGWRDHRYRDRQQIGATYVGGGERYGVSDRFLRIRWEDERCGILIG